MADINKERVKKQISNQFKTILNTTKVRATVSSSTKNPECPQALCVD